MRQSVELLILGTIVALIGWSCRSDSPEAKDDLRVSVGMPCSVAESNMLAAGGKLTSMGWPNGNVYMEQSGKLIAIVGDGSKKNPIVTRIYVCPRPPIVVTDWPEVKTYELKKMPN